MRATETPLVGRLTASAVFIASAMVSPLVISVATSVANADSAAEQRAELEKMFEQKVRPVLATRCYKCHGPRKQEAGLRLDSRSAVLAGADDGPVVAVGKPDESRLIQAVRRGGEIEMPPDDELSADEVAVLAHWVELGLPWPGGPDAAAKPVDIAELAEQQRRTHWSYQPIRRPELPAVKRGDWPLAPIDYFVLARLEAAGLAPSPDADRYTFLRRATLDLWGIPPTEAEVQAFVKDESAEAYEHVIDRLLGSPLYGQRWGRHWLDIARYADSRGYSLEGERYYAYAYTYRDYVIDAFNRDLPFDQFIIEQLAADRLPPGSDNRSLAALGFMTVGRQFLNNEDIIDDRIDVVSRGLLGLTVACARCHTHKYDAIATEDYYSLYGVFASATPPQELPLIGDPKQAPGYQEFRQELDRLNKKMDEFRVSKRDELVDHVRSHVDAYLIRIAAPSDAQYIQAGASLGLGRLRQHLVDRWREFMAQQARADHPVLGPWSQLTQLADDQFEQQALPLWETYGSAPSDKLNPLVKEVLLRDPRPTSKTQMARRYGQLLQKTYQQWKEAGGDEKAGGDGQAGNKLSAESRQVLDLLLATESPTNIKPDQLDRFLDTADAKMRKDLQTAIDKHEAHAPGAPPRAMSLVDKPHLYNPYVFVRGKPGQRGKNVPRQFLLILAGPQRKPFADGGGRLDLARAIVAPDNPLTARVLANRVWMHHFGEPLVSTPSDFGIRSDPPSHPDVLDYLAASLHESGWSLKNLHRTIMLSRTYRQASQDRPDCRAADPANRLLWKMNRRRLDLESLRDSLLFVSGQLDTRLGGRPEEIARDAASRRRTVYGRIDRQDLPGLFRVFDFANPDQSSARRPTTTVPQQALFLLNSPFVLDRAKAVAELPGVVAQNDSAARVDALYRAVYSRPPRADEIDRAVGFIEKVTSQPLPDTQLDPWQQLAHVLLMSNEFSFVD